MSNSPFESEMKTIDAMAREEDAIARYFEMVLSMDHLWLYQTIERSRNIGKVQA